MFRRKKQENEIEQKTERKIFKTVNFADIKDFINFGMNKTLMNLKIMKMADIKSREALASKDDTKRDWVKIMITIMVIGIIGAVAYTIINSLLGAGACQTKLTECLVREAARTASAATGGTIPG